MGDNPRSTVEGSILENTVVGVPPVFTNLTRQLDKLVEEPFLNPKVSFPAAPFASARKDLAGNRRPQAIAHRGYKAEFPENTMSAFRGAVQVGAEGLETDVHLTKDGVVVLSHDKDLKRCFGREEKVIDCDYDFLRQFKTLKAPHEPMPRLVDLLEYLTQPGLEDIWVVLDIKLDNNANDVMRLIGDTIQSVRSLPTRPWQSRIVLGCWAAKYLPLCSRYLPGFSVMHIGFSTSVASFFFRVPRISFSIHQGVLMSFWGRQFIRKAQREGRPVYGWTANDEARMRWDIERGLDGVITDDPKLFLAVRSAWHLGVKNNISARTWLEVCKMNFWAFVFTVSFWFMYGYGKTIKL